MQAATRPLDPRSESHGFPLQSYAALGDGRSVALVAPDGAVVWWCVPDIDSPPLVGDLLDPGVGGSFVLQPTEPFRSERSYREDSNVLETTFTTASGVARVTESMNSTLAGRLPWCELARRIEVLSGSVTMRASFAFGTRGDEVSPWIQPNPNGCIFHVGPVLGLFRATPNMAILREEDRCIEAEGTLRAGERALVAVVAGEDEPLGVPPCADMDARIDLSDEAWRSWAHGLRYDGPHRETVRRSALMLKLLLYSPSGAIAAAATTSLPERIGGPKNYDYRFAWIRDAAYTLAAFLRLGVIPESKAAFTWLLHRVAVTGPRVCYRLDGSPVPDLQEIDMAGYAGSRPVVVGNVAARQHQHGIYGDLFEAASLFVRAGNVLDERSGIVLARLADACADGWRRRDAGMWELEDAEHYTMSKVSCWQALDRAVELAEAGHLPSTCVPRWSRERDRIVAWVDEHCWSDRKTAYVFHPGSERLDAAMVLAVRFRFPRVERLSATCDAIRRELGTGPHRQGHGPWLYRYSGVDAEEGAFLACTFWLVEAYAELGRADEAAALMDEALAALPAGVGVLAEMVDPHGGDFLGNLPQGLSHLAVIHAALSLAHARRELAPGGSSPRTL